VPADGVVRLRVLVDSCSVEVFTEDGLSVMSVFTLADPAGDALRFVVERGTVTVSQCDVNELEL
jgi:sucrose-6-phosphate hydrolase SacC (GH32 family)